MIEIVPFKAQHLKEIRLQHAQTYLSSFVTEEHGRELEQQSSFSAIRDGLAVGAAGLIKHWEGRSVAWAILSEVGPRDFMTIHHAVKNYLDCCFTRRIELTVDYDFIEGHRWARALGFTMEAERLRKYNQDGGDASLYARVL